MTFTIHSMGIDRDWQQHGRKFEYLEKAVEYLFDRGAEQKGWMFLMNFRVYEIREDGSPVGAERINGCRIERSEGRPA